MATVAKALWSKYLSVLHQRPMLTQMAQTATLMGLGDVIAQRLVEEDKGGGGWRGHDCGRTLRFVGLGCFFVAPVIRGWYLTMERLVSPKTSPVRSTLVKVAMDQLGFAPIFNALFISILGALQTKTAGQIKEKLRLEYPDVMVKNWQVWPGVQMVNFFFVPFLLRPLVVSVVALFWNCYLSWKTNRD